MKPSIPFLKKCQDGKVGPTFTYSARSGGQYGFRGGEKTYEKHREAGYVNPASSATLGRRGEVTLTEAGFSAIKEHDAKEQSQ